MSMLLCRKARDFRTAVFIFTAMLLLNSEPALKIVHADNINDIRSLNMTVQMAGTDDGLEDFPKLRLRVSNTATSEVRVRILKAYFHGEVILRSGSQMRVMRHYKCVNNLLSAIVVPDITILNPGESIGIDIELSTDFICMNPLEPDSISADREERQQFNRRALSVFSRDTGYEVYCITNDRRLVSNVLIVPPK
jgi:hypothetical protein